MCAKATSQLKEAQNPLILRCHRLMDAFAKSDDERDFFIDRQEGFIVYVDLDKTQEELDSLEEALKKGNDRFCLIPKMTFYETKKIMEGFVNEKVYDIDTKEKLLDIIQSKEARENFLEFIFDHHSEFEKWQQYYQERSRIRIIEWLRQNNFHFVFEEDLELPRNMLEKLKKLQFEVKADKDLLAARKELFNRAKVYYSNEALNPKPKRGRPPKQIAKTDVPLQSAIDIYTTVPNNVRPFLYTPDHASSMAATFSTKFDSDEGLLAVRKSAALSESGIDGENLNQKLAALRSITSSWAEGKEPPKSIPKAPLRELLAAGLKDSELETKVEKSKSKSKTNPSSHSPAKLSKSAPPAKSAAKKPEKATNNKPRRIQPLKRRIVTSPSKGVESSKSATKKAVPPLKDSSKKVPPKRHVKPLVKKPATSAVKAKAKPSSKMHLRRR